MTEERQNQSANHATYEVVEHTADWALRVYGADWEQLLINAAIGMSSLLVSDLNLITTEEELSIELEAIDAETLLVDWLSELAYWAEVRQLVFRDYSLNQVTENRLSAVVRGSQVPELLKHIKAVTYHELRISKTDSGLVTTVVFDV